jgi:hypothetical protein
MMNIRVPAVDDNIKYGKPMCAKCKRLQSLMLSVLDAWDNQNELPDGYKRLRFSIEAMRSEDLGAN